MLGLFFLPLFFSVEVIVNSCQEDGVRIAVPKEHDYHAYDCLVLDPVNDIGQLLLVVPSQFLHLLRLEEVVRGEQRKTEEEDAIVYVPDLLIPIRPLNNLLVDVKPNQEPELHDCLDLKPENHFVNLC